MKSNPNEDLTAQAQVRVFRYDPSQDRMPRYDAFRVPWQKGMVVLDTLQFIYENLDGSLAFEHGCRYGRCGLCALKMNGKPRLACQTLAEPAMTLEPLDNFPIVKDLVVERQEIDRRIRQVQPFLQRDPRRTHVPEVLEPQRFATFREVSRCIGCLACHSSCPSFSLNRYAFSGPSVFVDLARYALDPRDALDRTPLAYSAGLFNCFECAKCQEVCPQHIAVEASVLERLRSLAVHSKMVPPAVGEVTENLRASGRPFMTIGPGAKTFLEKHAAAGAAEQDAEEKIGLFIGCTINADPRLQRVGLRVLDMLQKKGKKKVEIPGEQVCCGLPWMQLGQKEEAQNLVERNVLAFEKRGIRRVVSLCPGCAMVMKKEWPGLFARKEKRAPLFQVHDLTEFLLELLSGEPEKMKPLCLKVTFHDPCHLGRGQGIYEAPREILRRLPAVEMREMEGADRCCGGGGMVRATNWKLAQSAALRKVDGLRDLKVEGIVTTCPTCLLQLTAAVKSSGSKNLKVLHLIDLIHQAL